ncbi:hypothetical protein P8452_65815 [Trifolium repens]|nr:hypothetical protein P8452_65815 [Trifolium repens]
MNLRSLPRCGDDGIYFTHGWSNIRTCYVDAEGKGGWVLLTYIRPQLFVLVLKDRYYRDLIVKQLYPHMCLKLSRSLFGADQNLGWGGSVFMPDCHDSENFAHCFVVILSDSDISSKSLTMIYGNYASKIFSTNGGYVKLIDEKGMEWACTVEYNELPYEASHCDYSLNCTVTTVIKDLAGSFLPSSLFELLCHCYGRSYIKQTMTALCSLYDERMDFNMRPMEMMVHSEICCSLLENSIFCLLSIHVLRVITLVEISTGKGSILFVYQLLQQAS